MRTVKQISELTGISVRALHYYDEIGLLKPSEVTDAGYRLYDDIALEALQQILFFKELDLPLKEVKEIMASPHFDKMHALNNHKKLLILKRNRLNGLIALVNKTLEGAKTVSFKEFDMSEYFQALEAFKKEHADEVTKYWGSVDTFNGFMEDARAREADIAQIAIKQYGSIGKYTEAMKKNLSNFTQTMEQLNSIKDNLDYYQHKTAEIMKRLTSDLNTNASSNEVQQIVEELIHAVDETNEAVKNVDMGDNYWGLMSELCLSNSVYIETTDKQYGNGASRFIGEALSVYCENNKK